MHSVGLLCYTVPYINIFLKIGKFAEQSDFHPSRKSVGHEVIYDEIPDPSGQDSGYEQIIPEQRQIVLNPTSQYEDLKLDDYVNAESSI